MNHQINTNTMETITITKRIINGKEVYNKRFDNYDKGYWGDRISKYEYEESKENKAVYSESNETAMTHKLYIIERITYEN